MTIAESQNPGKPVDTASNEETKSRFNVLRRLPKDALLLAILVLASTGSFGLGVVAGRDSGGGKSQEKVRIEKPEAALAAVGAAKEATTPEAVETKQGEPAEPAPSGGQYVGSKTGTKYYLPWCGTAKRIKDENKVWFNTKAEAEAAGYEPAKNCKGI